MPLEPKEGDILKHRRTGTLYRVTRVKPKDLSDPLMPMTYAYYDIETVATGRKTWTNEYRIDKDSVLEEQQEAYTAEAIEASINDLRNTPGVTIERIQESEKFGVVIIWGTHKHDGGVETGALKVYRKARS